MDSSATNGVYDTAAQGWTGRIAALGYPSAYHAFASRALTQLPRPGSVYDIGCGSGDFAAAVWAVQGDGARFTLVDPSGPMLERAVARLARHGVTAALKRSTLAGAQGRFDMVLAAHVIEHCPDQAKALVALSGLTRLGGSVLLIVSKPHWC